MSKDPQKPGEGQAPPSELTSKALIFGSMGGRGYLPLAITLMSGQPSPSELEEAEELLLLAILETRRWRNIIRKEAARRATELGLVPLYNADGLCVHVSKTRVEALV